MIPLFKKKEMDTCTPNEKAQLRADIERLEKRIWRLENPNKFKIGQMVKWEKHIEYRGMLFTCDIPAGTGMVSKLPGDHSSLYTIVCDGFIIEVMEHRLSIKK